MMKNLLYSATFKVDRKRQAGLQYQGLADAVHFIIL